MSWKMLDMAVRRLNPSSLREWKSVFESMSVWMQAVMVGALVLLIGVSVLSCWWGLKMKRSARFAAGAVSVFHIVMIILVMEYSIPTLRALIIAAIAGVGAGFVYAFLERVFQFAAGFVFGTVLSAYLLPKCFHQKPTAGSGIVWTLVIAGGAGVLFALLAKKLKFVLTALEGGVVLGLVCDAFLPVNRTPWVKDKLTGAQIENLLPLLIAASGVLIQLFQLLAIRAEQKALAIPTGDERDHIPGTQDEPEHASDRDASGEDTPGDEDALSMAQAEEVLVEKAKELALAAARSAEHARLKERYEDVMAGLYGTEVAAQRLGMSEEAFVEGMRKAGYSVPGEEEAKEPELVEEETAGEPESVEEETAGKPESIKEETAGKPESVEEEATGEPESVEEETAGKPESVEEEATGESESVEEETTGKPEPVEEEKAAQQSESLPADTGDRNGIV